MRARLWKATVLVEALALGVMVATMLLGCAGNGDSWGGNITIVGGIDCVESAASVGDEYDTRGVIALEGTATPISEP